MIEPRPYEGANDLDRLIAFNAAAYSTHLGVDGYLHVGNIPHRIYNGLRRYNPAELVHLWEDEAGNLLGWDIIYPNFIAFDVQIHPAHRGGDLEARMVAWVEARVRDLANRDGKGKTITSDVYESDEARRAVLTAQGYQPPAQATFVCTLRSLREPVPDPVLPAGFTIRAAEGDHEAEKLAEVHAGAFGSSWTPEQYHTLMHTPGYDAEREMVVVAPDGRFAAFCIYWLDTVSQTGLFEPVGTHADFQRMGLGRALMNAAMQRMVAAGMTLVEVTHELDNPASTGLYAALGFKPHCCTSGYEKPL